MTAVVAQSTPSLPIGLVGWIVLVAGLAITAAWTWYLYSPRSSGIGT